MPFTFTLISRRCHYHVGTRFNTRGLDKFLRPANCVETEQIFQYNNKLYSFIQIRGSIPIFWKQQVGLKYTPPVKILNDFFKVFLI